MAFELIVEDGTGVTGANSYCSLDAANAYHGARLRTEPWQEATEDDQSKALAMATSLIDQYFRWGGARVVTTRDSPAWPRYGMVDRSGLAIDSATIPTSLIEATAEFAMRLLESNRVKESEDSPVGMASGGRSKNYAAGRVVPVVPAIVSDKLGHFTQASTIRRVA